MSDKKENDKFIVEATEDVKKILNFLKENSSTDKSITNTKDALYTLSDLSQNIENYKLESNEEIKNFINKEIYLYFMANETILKNVLNKFLDSLENNKKITMDLRCIEELKSRIYNIKLEKVEINDSEEISEYFSQYNNIFNQFKTEWGEAVEYIKKQANYNSTKKDTVFDHLSEIIRPFFMVIDIIITNILWSLDELRLSAQATLGLHSNLLDTPDFGNRSSIKSMDETGTPGAKFFTGGKHHFFNRSDKAQARLLGDEIEQLYKDLEALGNPLPRPDISNK